MSSTVRVEGLTRYFGEAKAVDDVTCDVKQGEVFALPGETCGAGLIGE